MTKLYINPLPVRIWHWTNAVGFLLMIASGLQIRYLDLLQITSFKTAVTLHNWIGFVLIANFFVWLSFYLYSDKIRDYHPELNPKKYFRGAFAQLRYYAYGIFRGDPNPHHVSLNHKFNPLQSLTYQIIMMLLVPLQFFSGLLLWDLARFSWLVDLFGGVRIVDTVHVLLFIFFSSFVFIHVYLASLGHTRSEHFKAMITGYEDVEDSPGQADAAR